MKLPEERWSAVGGRAEQHGQRLWASPGVLGGTIQFGRGKVLVRFVISSRGCLCTTALGRFACAPVLQAPRPRLGDLPLRAPGDEARRRQTQVFRCDEVECLHVVEVGVGVDGCAGLEIGRM